MSTANDRSHPHGSGNTGHSSPAGSTSVLRDGGTDNEEEQAAPWIVRTLVGSLPGRIVMSSYESFRATGTTVVCLSPWGDGNPVSLPNVRFRDLAVSSIIAVTGGMAAVATPILAPVGGAAVAVFGGSIFVQMGLQAGFSVTTSMANNLVISSPLNKMIPIYSTRLQTTAVKVMLVTITYRHTMTDAGLGFFRSSQHHDRSLWFASVQDYLAVGKGWFSPYLFATGRRPIIPRNIKPDIIFCHGPFTPGDYKLGEALLQESALKIELCDPPPPLPASEGEEAEGPSFIDNIGTAAANIGTGATNLVSSTSQNIQNFLAPPSTPRAPSPAPTSKPEPAAVSTPTTPRRMVLVLVGIKPHRAGMWVSSQRPSESVMNYVLFNGCPAIVFPVKSGAPLVAWDGLTLKQLWDVTLPEKVTRDAGEEVGKEKVSGEPKAKKFEGIVSAIMEFLGMCIDWERVKVAPTEGSEEEAAEKPGDAAAATAELDDEGKKRAVKDAIRLLVGAAVRTKESDKVREEVDEDRAGLAMWRIP